MSRFGNQSIAFLAATVLIGFAGIQILAAPFPFLRKPPAKPVATKSVAKLNWAPDIQSAHKSSLDTNKPMLLVFGAEWCGYCKKLEATTLAQPDMVEYVNASFVPVHIDLDKDPQIAEVLEVESIPCSVVLSPDADLLGKLVGYADARQFKKTLENTERLYAVVQQRTR